MIFRPDKETRFYPKFKPSGIHLDIKMNTILATFKEIVLATGNAGKIKELSTMLAPIVCMSQKTLNIVEVEETGLSFIENALIKARHASFYANKPALADDSGLVVPALNGRPGIYSARYAGTGATDLENLNLLLNNARHLQGEAREAYFYCAIALVQTADDPTPVIATGLWRGSLALKPSGCAGFGYDPLFYLEAYQCTAAELPETIKNTMSHRAKALIELERCLSEHFNP
jgi:XTP/dITP diphosphohydrolase